MAANFDRSDILRTAQIFHESGDIWELRIPKASRSKTISGYYDNTQNFADSIIGLADDGFPGFYFTANPVQPDLFARSANKYEKYAQNTTTDGDIARRRWLLVDLDPIRPAGISSSDSEHAAALQMAGEIRTWLISRGWHANAFILADSGNGGHLAAKIDLPNDEESKKLIENCLKALDFIFSDDKIKVDCTTFNAARIWKIYGTMARKGSDTPDRPHRLSKLLEVPDRPETITKEQLEALAAIPPKVDPIKINGNGQPFDPAKYAQDHGANVLRTKPWSGWELALLEECPFDPSHNRGEACIMVHPSGAKKFSCKHDSCKDNDWHALKRKWGSPQNEKPNDTGQKEISEEELKELPRTFNPRLEVHLEDGNFITKYMVYGKTTSDAYEEYHFASGLVLLSVAADRQIVISMKHGDIYPNIWIFPIGDSTVSRKTTAHKLCKLILKNKYPKRSLPSSFSPEALMDAISSTPRCYYLKDEAGSLLSSLCKDYMAETRDFLAEIFECDDYYRKLKKYECNIKDPYITQYLMTTPDNLKEYTTPLDLTSGWLLRYLWMYPNYPKDWKPFAEKDASDFDRFATITGEYNLIVEKLTTPRRLTMTEESMQFFQEWHRAIEETAMQEADNITKALTGRLMTYAIKMAALFTIGRADYDENSKIELPHIQEASRLVVEYFLPIGKIIIDEVARAESKNTQDKIIGTIKRYNGRISQRDLLRVLHMKLKEVEEAIEALILSEEIEKQFVKTKKAKVLYYVMRECHSDIVSHNLVYKGNNKGSLYTPSCGTMTHRQMGQDGGAEVEDTPPSSGPHPLKEDPGFQRWNAGRKKRVCLQCGEHFSYDLGIHYNGGYICARCHREGKPPESIKADAQIKLSEVASAN